MNNNKQRFGIQLKILLWLGGIIIVCLLVLFASLFFYNRSVLRQDLSNKLENVISISALLIDGDAHATLKSEADHNSPEYQKVYQALIEIHDNVQGINYPYTMRVNDNGEVLFIVDSTDDDPAKIGDIYPEPGKALKENAASINKVVVEPDMYTDEWGTYLSAYAPIYRSDGKVDGILAIDIPADEVLNREIQMGWILLGCFVLTTVVTLVFSILIISPLVRPIKKIKDKFVQIATVNLPGLAKGIEAVAGGDLTHQTFEEIDPIAHISNDELGELVHVQNNIIEHINHTGRAFSDMVLNIRNLIRQVYDSANSLNDAASRLAASAKEAGDATSQISITIQQVATGINQQAESISKTASSSEQMSRAIDGVARGAQEQSLSVVKASNVTSLITTAIQQVAVSAEVGANGVSQAAETAREGARTVEETIQGMSTIKEKVGLSAQKVQEMGQRSSQIGAIVGTIDDIASQTNLLALNAAIEAARAGEHGKGFAVVADEVRKLAEKSTAATKEIASLIHDIQDTVTEAVTAMDQGATEVEKGVQRANKSDEALGEILKAVQAVNQQVDEIALAAKEINSSSNELVSAMDSVSAVVEQNTAFTEEMSANSDDVTQSVESIASVSEENSAAVEEVSASTQDMSLQVSEVNQSAQKLADMAQSLLQRVKQFRIDD